MTIQKCDRCGVELPRKHAHVETRNIFDGCGDVCGHYRYYDLCKDCYEKLQEFLDGKDEHEKLGEV